MRKKNSTRRTEDYFRERAARADIPKALTILKRAGKGKRPMKGDAIRPTVSARSRGR